MIVFSKVRIVVPKMLTAGKDSNLVKGKYLIMGLADRLPCGFDFYRAAIKSKDNKEGVNWGK
mgnify:FL=1